MRRNVLLSLSGCDTRIGAFVFGCASCTEKNVAAQEFRNLTGIACDSVETVRPANEANGAQSAERSLQRERLQLTSGEKTYVNGSHLQIIYSAKCSQFPNSSCAAIRTMRACLRLLRSVVIRMTSCDSPRCQPDTVSMHTHTRPRRCRIAIKLLARQPNSEKRNRYFDCERSDGRIVAASRRSAARLALRPVRAPRAIPHPRSPVLHVIRSPSDSICFVFARGASRLAIAVLFNLFRSFRHTY